MPYVVAQPKIRRNILASLLAKNSSEVAAQQEWEAEWNQMGLASRLSEKVTVHSSIIHSSIFSLFVHLQFYLSILGISLT